MKTAEARREYFKAYNKAYREKHREKLNQRQKAYRHTDEGKAVLQKYWKSATYKAVQERYKKSAKGQAQKETAALRRKRPRSAKAKVTLYQKLVRADLVILGDD